MEIKRLATLNKSLFFFFGLLITFFLLSNSVNAQEIQVKGIVKGQYEEETELLSGVSVYLKGTNEGVTTNKKGEFTFPKKLKKGDVLFFSYLGFEKQNVKITEKSSFLTITLKEEDIEMLGALNSQKKYKSKRTKQ